MEPDEFDLAGFCVGVVERDRLLDGTAARAGDALIGIASSRAAQQRLLAGPADRGRRRAWTWARATPSWSAGSSARRRRRSRRRRS